jgi:hypothetical protein
MLYLWRCFSHALVFPLLCDCSLYSCVGSVKALTIVKSSCMFSDGDDLVRLVLNVLFNDAVNC